MDYIALLCFHKEFDICAARVQLLRRFNPSMKIFGLFGGEEADLRRARRVEDAGLEHLFALRGKEPNWKWKNTDLAVRKWYTELGRHVTFDRLYVVQWDLLFFDALPVVYRGLSR